MTEVTDHALVERSLNGDRRAFGTLVERYQKPVFNLALRISSNSAEAEDITQSTFLKAFEKLDSFNSDYKFFSWLYRIAINESLNSVGQRRSFEELDDRVASEGDGPEEKFGRNEVERLVSESLMGMAFEYRVVLILRHLMGLSYSEIGEIVGVPEQIVKSRLFTSRQIMKKFLAQKGVTKDG